MTNTVCAWTVVVAIIIASRLLQGALPNPIEPEARIIGNSLETFLPKKNCQGRCWWVFKHPDLPDSEVVSNSSNLTLDGSVLDLSRYGDYYYVDKMSNEIFSVVVALYNTSKDKLLNA